MYLNNSNSNYKTHPFEMLWNNYRLHVVFFVVVGFLVCSQLWIVWCLGSTWRFFFSLSSSYALWIAFEYVYACFFVRRYFRMQLHINVMRKQDDEMFSVLLSPKSSSCRIVSCACVLSFSSLNEHSFLSFFFWHNSDWRSRFRRAEKRKKNRSSMTCIRSSSVGNDMESLNLI